MIDSLVSIVMPNYNGSKYMQRTLDSLIYQTWQEWELIFVDDCSLDNSLDIIEEYRKNDDRIKVIKQPKNAGAAQARNRAISLANGRYIAFLDSDDCWFPTKLEKQMKFMLENHHVFTFTEYMMIDENDAIIKERVESPPYISYKRLLSGYPLMCSSVIIDKKEIGDFEMPDIRSGQDYATWAMLLRTREINAYNIGEVLAKYRKASSSLSGNKLKAFKRTWKINREYENKSLFENIWYITLYGFKWIKKHFIH